MDENNRNTLSALALAVLVGLGVLVLLPVLVMPMMVGMMGGWATAGGMMSGGYWWGWVIIVLFWALLIGGIVLVVAWLFRQGYLGGRHSDDTLSARNGSASALDIVKLRYARGEITKEEFEQISRDLLAG